jgi:hypothetical protein
MHLNAILVVAFALGVASAPVGKLLDNSKGHIFNLTHRCCFRQIEPCTSSSGRWHHGAVEPGSASGRRWDYGAVEPGSASGRRWDYGTVRPPISFN